MTHSYKGVGWNRAKKIYDRVLAIGVVLYLLVFVGVGFVLHPNATIEILSIRALGTSAFLLLHVILSIGPLARLDRRYLPWLYNRRHLGVTMFVLGLGHGLFALVQFHALGDRNPLVSVFTSELVAARGWTNLAEAPFQPLGAIALVILFLMAVTSHDFWLANLTAPVWKRLHMLVYLAYGLLVGHVALGVLQAETSPPLAGLVAAGMIWLLALHLAAGWRERSADRAVSTAAAGGWVDVCGVDEIAEGRALTATIAGERVAVFRYGGRISALSNACQHQNGPLGEGRVINGCVVCPWHGYEYRPESGQSPPPFTEKVPTFNVRIAGGRVAVDPRPNPAGTEVDPAVIGSVSAAASAPSAEFYVGYRPQAPAGIARFNRRVALSVVAGSVILAAVIAALQAPFAPSFFEFGVTRTFTGTVLEDPYPTLALERPGAGSSRLGRARYLLVARGKFGAGTEVEAVAGRTATLAGSLIYRDNLSMVEVAPGSARATPDAARDPGATSTVAELGVYTLRGEIVDSKCYLGVMKPGRAKTHKACAINCIRGGIAPLFVVTDAAGGRDHLLLVAADGSAVNDRVLALVAEPVEITGAVVRRDNLLFLEADPENYQTIAER